MPKPIEALLKEFRVFRTGHFLLSSGLHSAGYFEKFRIIESPKLLSGFAERIAKEFQNSKIEMVCGPTTGGILVAFEVARRLDCQCCFAESGPSGRVIRRGFTIEPGMRVLVVDDVLTTGRSIQDTLKALEPFQVDIAGIGVLIDRSDKASLEHPYFAVYRKTIPNYAPKDCPLCRQGIPLEIPGGKKQ
jgi:orotate phosphoribosyltransferase